MNSLYRLYGNNPFQRKCWNNRSIRPYLSLLTWLNCTPLIQALPIWCLHSFSIYSYLWHISRQLQLGVQYPPWWDLPISCLMSDEYCVVTTNQRKAYQSRKLARILSVKHICKELSSLNGLLLFIVWRSTYNWKYQQGHIVELHTARQWTNIALAFLPFHEETFWVSNTNDSLFHNQMT